MPFEIRLLLCYFVSLSRASFWISQHNYPHNAVRSVKCKCHVCNTSCRPVIILCMLLKRQRGGDGVGLRRLIAAWVKAGANLCSSSPAAMSRRQCTGPSKASWCSWLAPMSPHARLHPTSARMACAAAAYVSHQCKNDINVEVQDKKGSRGTGAGLTSQPASRK